MLFLVIGFADYYNKTLSYEAKHSLAHFCKTHRSINTRLTHFRSKSTLEQILDSDPALITLADISMIDP